MPEIGFSTIAAALAVAISSAALVTSSCHASNSAANQPVADGTPTPAQPTGWAPELPRVQVDTAHAISSGATITVLAGGDFQAALGRARPGDIIVLQSGATYTGPFTLPAKMGTGWITIQSSNVPLALPPGVAVTPADTSKMPQLVSSSGPVLSAAPGAHNYRLIGLEIRPAIASGSTTALRTLEGWFRQTAAGTRQVTQPRTRAQAAKIDNLVALGVDAHSLSELPNHIIIDRCYIHGDPGVGTRRGIAMNSTYTAVMDSYLSDFKRTDVDAQAIEVWNGSGPFKIENNFLEASGEDLLFGGEDPAITDLVPSDIEITGNHFSKSLTWKADDPSYAGIAWSVKNLLELKNASRVLIKGNLFEYNWPQSQNGFSILFTVRNQEGSAPWSIVSDVTFVDNVVRHAGSGINILGYDDNHASQQTQRILVKNNLFYDIGGTWGAGELFQMLNGTLDAHFLHNTALQTANIITADGLVSDGFEFTDNIVAHNRYGIIGTNKGVGFDTLKAYFPGYIVTGNVFIGGTSSNYPAGNLFPQTIADTGFRDPGMHDYRLDSGSRYRGRADDGSDIGVDMIALCKAFAGSSQNLTALIPSCIN